MLLIFLASGCIPEEAKELPLVDNSGTSGENDPRFEWPSDPTTYIGEIRFFTQQNCPKGWALADGSSLPVDKADALFQYIGVTFGRKDGFVVLPDLRGRTPVHAGEGAKLKPRSIGEAFGADRVSKTMAHGHDLRAGNVNLEASPDSAAEEPKDNAIGTFEKAFPAFTNSGEPNIPMGKMIDYLDQGLPLEATNRPPSIALTACIAVLGTFPPRY